MMEKKEGIAVYIYRMQDKRDDKSQSPLFLSRAAAVRQKCPATIFLISGIFPLVPGAGIYWTVYYLITEQLRLAVYTGYEAVKVAIAIVLGIVVIFELPQGWFWWAVKK